MTTLRKVLAIVRRSFYRTNRHPITTTTLHRYTHSAKSHHQKLHPTSTHLLNYHYHKYTTKPSKSPHPITSITIEPKNTSKSSFKKQLIFIATVTTLSYIGYKYYFYDIKDTTNPPSKSVTSAIAKTATDIIENTLINANLTFKIGLFWDNRKQYNKALYFYKLYLRKPNDKRGEYAALNNMSIIYYKLNQYENALIAFELLGDAQIKERNLEFLRAHCYHNMKEYKLALKYYHKFLNNHKSKEADIIAAYNNMALLYYELGQYAQAYEYFCHIGDANIKDKNYGFRVAHSLQNINQFDQSVKYYDLYLNNPNTTKENEMNTYHNLGVLYYDNGKDKKAIEMFNRLGEDEIKNRNLEFKMAHLCAKIDDKKGAIKYLRQCKNKPEIYGEYAAICQGIIAQILYEIGDYKAAINEFELLGKEQIIMQDLYFPAAFAYFKCEQYDKALMYYKLLILNTSEKLTAEEVIYIHSRICLIYYKQKNYEKVCEIIDNTLMKIDGFISKYNMEFIVAHANHKLKKFNTAEKYYKMFLENDKSDGADIINAHQNLALLYYDLNDFVKCIEYFNLMEEDMIMNRGLEFYIAHSLQECEQNRQSIKYYKSFLHKIESKGKNNMNENDLLNIKNVYHNLGNVYYVLNEFENACDVWNNLNDSDIGNRNLAMKLSKCYDMIGDSENKNKYFELANEINEKQNMEKINIAKMYYNMYQNELAIDIFEEIDDNEIIKYNAEFIAAHSYQLIGNSPKAIKYYQMGLENRENRENKDKSDIKKDEINSAYHNLGCVYHDCGEYKNAINCFNKLSMEHIMVTNMGFIIGVCYHNMSNHCDALKYYKMFLDNPINKAKGINDNDVLSCYNNMVILYYYHFNDYINAWNILQKMGENNIKEKKLEFESAHCAQKLNKNKISLKYYQLFLMNTPINEMNDEIINNIYNNIVVMYTSDKNNMDKNVFDEFKKNAKNNNKQQELQLFLECINKEKKLNE